MARITVEDCLDQIPNRFSLVLVVAERTKQLLKGAPTLNEDARDNKEIVRALREVAAGVVRADVSAFNDNEFVDGFAGPLRAVVDAGLPPAADDALPPDA